MNALGPQRTSLDEALTHISSEDQVWVRLAAIQRDDAKWHLRLLELTSGAPPPSWKLMTWDYPWAMLTGRLETGRTVSEWIPIRSADRRFGSRGARHPTPRPGTLLAARPGRLQDHPTRQQSLLP